jgi:hypothetical protein
MWQAHALLMPLVLVEFECPASFTFTPAAISMNATNLLPVSLMGNPAGVFITHSPAKE